MNDRTKRRNDLVPVTFKLHSGNGDWDDIPASSTAAHAIDDIPDVVADAVNLFAIPVLASWIEEKRTENGEVVHVHREREDWPWDWRMQTDPLTQ